MVQQNIFLRVKRETAFVQIEEGLTVGMIIGVTP